ncbi:MAG: LysR family transcriptional regulator [Lachnospiraceae bacterium]
MEIRQLRYFLKICDVASFSKAAKELYISQQALSRTIKNLEDDLDCALFYRTNVGVKLTECGHYLEKKGKHIIEEFDIVLQDMEKLKNDGHGEVRVAFSFGVMSALSPDLISDFRAAYPKIDLKISEYPDDECEKAVFSEEVSVGLSIGPIDKNKFSASVIKRDAMCLVVHASDPLYTRDSVSFSDLKGIPVVVVDKHFKVCQSFISRCRDAGFNPEFYHTTKEMILVHKLAAWNKCPGVSVRFISENIPDTRAIPFNDPTYIWEVCLITKKGAVIDRATELFIEYINGIRDLSVPEY